MQSIRNSRFAPGLIWMVLALIYHPTLQAAPATSFRLVRNQFIAVPVSVNGTGPYDFLLDTGTNSTAIDSNLARELQIRITDRIELTTPTGPTIVPRGFLDRVKFAEAEAKGVETLITDLTRIRKIDPNIRGVLGQSFLERFTYLIERIVILSTVGDV